MARTDVARRMIKLQELLEHSRVGLTREEILNALKEYKFEIGDRTLSRDIESLKGLIPIIEKIDDSSRKKRYSVDRSIKGKKNLQLDPTELLIVYLSLNLLTPLKGSNFQNTLTTTFDKIRDIVGIENSKYFDEIEESFGSSNTADLSESIDPEVLNTCFLAKQEGQQLKITYKSATSAEPSIRNLGVLYIYFSNGVPYLLGKDVKDSSIKVFSVARMTEVEMIAEQFNEQLDEKDDYFADSFGVYRGGPKKKVVVEFSNPVSSFIKERVWHRSQSIIEKEGGLIEVHLEVGLGPELTHWISSYGMHARVISPVDLRDEVVKQAKATLELYSDKAGK